MAPIFTALEVWGSAELPGATVVSLIILFILTITLLALCARCQKHSFDLDQDYAEDRNSTLVRVIQMEDIPVAINNPAADDITKDEKYLSSLPEDGAVKPAGPWRIHALGDKDIITDRTNFNPAVTKPPVVETSLRSVDQTVSSDIENVLSSNKPSSELADVHLENHPRETDPDLSHNLTFPYNNTHHPYETIGVRNGPEDQRETTLNPYAIYEMNGPQLNGQNLQVQSTLAEEMIEDQEVSNVSDLYARVSKKNKHYIPSLENAE